MTLISGGELQEQESGSLIYELRERNPATWIEKLLVHSRNLLITRSSRIRWLQNAADQATLEFITN